MSVKNVHIVFQVINHLCHQCHTLTPDKLLLIILASFSGIRGICPSAKKISDRMGTSKRQIYRGIQRLEDQKLIKVTRVRGKHNVYELLFLSTTSDTNVTGQDDSTSDTYVTGTSDTYVTTPVTPMSHHRITKGITKVNNRGKKLSPLTDDFQLTEATSDKIEQLGFDDDEANLEIDKFMTYYMGKGEEKQDWQAVLQNWMIRAKGYKKERKIANKPDEIRCNLQFFNPDHANVNQFLNKAIDQIKSKSNGHGGLANGSEREGKRKN